MDLCTISNTIRISVFLNLSIFWENEAFDRANADSYRNFFSTDDFQGKLHSGYTNFEIMAG